MLSRPLPQVFLLLLFSAAVVVGQQPAVDTSRIGPQVGTRVPAFRGVDHTGRAQTLQGAMGPAGLMLVFFRSADW